MKYKLVIFDWDGTLMDSTPKIVNCMQKAAEKAQLAVPSENAVRQIIGISLLPAIQTLFACSSSIAERVAALYKDEYRLHDKTPHHLFEGAESLLSNLYHHPERLLAVATGKARNGLNSAWQASGVGHLFHGSRCADEAKSKPDPDMLLQLLEQFSCRAEQAVMIGDTQHDMKMAEAIGMARIGVSYGAHSTEQLRKFAPVEIVDDCRDLANLV